MTPMPSERDKASENPYEAPLSLSASEKWSHRTAKRVTAILGVLSLALALVPVPSLSTAIRSHDSFEVALAIGWHRAEN